MTMSVIRQTLCLILITVSIGQIIGATTKSWQHSEKMKAMESARASVSLKKNKVSDKLGFESVQPTSKTQKVGGFEDHSENRRKSGTSPQVDNKLDKSQFGKSFVDVEENLPRYDIGPGVNLTLDVPREIVNVNLDEDYMKDVFQGNLPYS